MIKVLNEVGWGRAAVAFLGQCRDLTGDPPSAMLVRHSERARIQSAEDILHASLTPLGKEAAHEFGSNLPPELGYRLFHSPLPRCVETAEEIQGGLLSQGAEAELKGALQFLGSPHGDDETSRRYIMRDRKAFIHNWLSGRYLPMVLEPSETYAQRVAQEITELSETARRGTLDIYVTHDLWIAALMFHWFGLPPDSDWIQYLDGFIVELCDERMTVHQRGNRREIDYPHWWRIPGS